MDRSPRSIAAKTENTVENLVEVFRCFVCMEKLQDARLCPHCSKMCCFQCIRRWLTEQRSQCPHCRASLHIHELVNCRWVDDVTQQLDSLAVTTSRMTAESEAVVCAKSETCDLHKERLAVFCASCKCAVCHKCALFSEKHASHTFRPIDDVYEEHLSRIQSEMETLQRRHTELIRQIQFVERNVESVKQAKEDRVREVRQAVEAMCARLDGQLKSKLMALMSKRSRLTQETELLESLLHEVDSERRRLSKAELIARTTHFLEMFAEVSRKPLLGDAAQAESGAQSAEASAQVCSPSFQPVSNAFASEIVPPFDASTFVIQSFSTLQRVGEPIYSEPLTVDGLNWRLKVYPNGNGVVRGNYLSVFLELSAACCSEPAKYEYRIEMIRCNSVQTNERLQDASVEGESEVELSESRNVVREFASDFEAGECWGYNRFFRLDLLVSDGFLNADDSLTLRFQVRAPTYYQKCRDQRMRIAQMETQLADLHRRVDDLQNQVRPAVSVRSKTKSVATGTHEDAVTLSQVQSADTLVDNSRCTALDDHTAPSTVPNLAEINCQREKQDEEDAFDDSCDDCTSSYTSAASSTLSGLIGARNASDSHPESPNRKPQPKDNMRRNLRNRLALARSASEVVPPTQLSDGDADLDLGVLEQLADSERSASADETDDLDCFLSPRAARSRNRVAAASTKPKPREQSLPTGDGDVLVGVDSALVKSRKARQRPALPARFCGELERELYEDQVAALLTEPADTFNYLSRFASSSASHQSLRSSRRSNLPVLTNSLPTVQMQPSYLVSAISNGEPLASVSISTDDEEASPLVSNSIRAIFDQLVRFRPETPGDAQLASANTADSDGAVARSASADESAMNHACDELND